MMATYEAVFLERADNLKYQVYAQLARHSVQEVSIVDLSRLLHWKYQTTYNVLGEIVDDLVAALQQPEGQLRAALLDARRLPLSIDAYRSLLARRSLPYALLDYAVQDHEPTLAAFMAAHFVSRTTLTRRLQKINALLATYHLRFRLASMDFDGPEVNVRYFLYAFYWWAHRAEYWALRAVDRRQLDQEVQSFSLVNGRALEVAQQHLFLAVIHVRLGRMRRIEHNAMLEALGDRIAQAALHGDAVPTRMPRVSIDLYNFFELSRPRFDAEERGEAAVQRELALLAAEPAQTVAQAFADAIRRASLRHSPLGLDLRANLLRLTFGYALFGGELPIPDDYLDGEREFGYDATVQAKCLAIIAALPQTPTYAGYHSGQASLALQVATLAIPYLRNQDNGDRIGIEVCVTPDASGVGALREFLNTVAWTATVVKNGGDLVITDHRSPLSATGQAHPERCCDWFPDALAIPAYRQALTGRIIACHRAKYKNAPQVIRRES